MKSTAKFRERIQKLKDANYILRLQLSEVKTRNRQLQRINARQGDVITKAIARHDDVKDLCKERETFRKGVDGDEYSHF